NGNTIGFTYDQFKAEIDSGRPVLIQVEGHTMLGYGYDDSSSLVYIHDTWDYSNHTMTWGGVYYNGSTPLQHYGVGVFILEDKVILATPTFSPPAGTYGTTQSVTISCATSGATIYYTTDGTDPDDTDLVYSSPISISSSQTLKAIAYLILWAPSSISEAVYVLNVSNGSGDNSGDTSGPAIVDMPITNIDGILVDPDVSVDPAGTVPITVDVTVTDQVQGSTPVPYPDNVTISYDVDITGSVTGVNLAFDLSFSGLTDLYQIHWLNGTSWEIPGNIVWNYVTSHVSFNVALPALRNGSTEIILGQDNPLPVTLSSFSAVFYNGTPVINWTTQSESNNCGWNIYRSASSNAGQSQQINFDLIPGTGTTSQPTEYSFIDEHETVVNQTYWYWLESVSGSGETETFGPVSLTIPLEEENTPIIPVQTKLWQNYPNPFNPTTFIKFDVKENEVALLTIFNIKGQIILSHEFEAGRYDYDWDAKDYGSGIYFYKLQSASYSQIKKMILVK
ncbi:MAG: chitobiase/beta-hexosaminidase C-terminal domain-containing protein, partial [Candidatus Cloacimonetes bacterium]|nr:chitobiase/beta-hexosaminidase C-terminal domain-containing protein [Candidatus Cloacimonadota bacterium]